MKGQWKLFGQCVMPLYIALLLGINLGGHARLYPKILRIMAVFFFGYSYAQREWNSFFFFLDASGLGAARLCSSSLQVRCSTLVPFGLFVSCLFGFPYCP
jgi:hypothetical protein